MTKTPSMFLLGKLEGTMKEITDGLGAKWSIAICDNSSFKISLTMPEMTSELNSIQEHRKKVLDFFGIDEDESTTNIEGIHSPKVIIRFAETVTIELSGK
jgi:hypothetical protein